MKPLLVSNPATAEKAYEERNNNGRPSIPERRNNNGKPSTSEGCRGTAPPLGALPWAWGWVDGAGSDWHLGLRSVHTRIGRLFRLVARNRGRRGGNPCLLGEAMEWLLPAAPLGPVLSGRRLDACYASRPR